MNAIVDTGFLVALFNAREPASPICEDLYKDFRGDLWTTEAVLTETLYLLGSRQDHVGNCLKWFERGIFNLAPLKSTDVAHCRTLMRTWADLPMDFADATLVNLAEKMGVREVWTLDRRDFSVYRAQGKAFKIRPGR